MDKRLLAAAVLVVVCGGAALFFPRQAPEKIRVLCAGSLLYPLQKAADAYMKGNPGSTVEVEGHGSIQVIRLVTELGDPADLLLTADYTLIPAMMYGSSTSKPSTDWYIRFSGNDVVLAYTGKSRYADEVSAENWYKVLDRSDVKFGFPNPMIDALGYRALMVMQLAEYEYGDQGIYERLVSRNFATSFTSVDLGGEAVVFVPEAQEPKGDRVFLRASSIQLEPLLQTGVIDYCFMYLSNARQYGLQYVELPGSINLGSPELADEYARVEVRFLHQRFATVGLNRLGRPIYYGLTVPSSAENPAGAARFAEYLLEGEASRIMASLWHPIYKPCYSDNAKGVPEPLRSITVADNLKPDGSS